MPEDEVSFVCGLTKYFKLTNLCNMTARSNVFSNDEESGRGYFSDTRSIIETHLAGNCY